MSLNKWVFLNFCSIELFPHLDLFCFFAMSLLLKYNTAIHLSPVLPALQISWRYFSIVVGGLQCIFLVIHLASKPIPSATVAKIKRNVGVSFFSSVMTWVFIASV